MSLVNTSFSSRECPAFAGDGVPITDEDVGSGVLLHGVTESRESWRGAGHVDRFLRWLLGTHHSGVALRLPDRPTAGLRVTQGAELISSPNQQETIR